MAIKVVDGQKFTWRKGKGSTFISDLNWREWPNSFYIHSHRTGKQMLFLVGEATRSNDEDQELQSIDYFNPGGNVTVTIFND